MGRGSWVVDRGSWVVGRGSCFVGRGSWVVGRGSWVGGRGSWVVGRGYCIVFLSKTLYRHFLSSVSLSIHPGVKLGTKEFSGKPDEMWRGRGGSEGTLW